MSNETITDVRFQEQIVLARVTSYVVAPYANNGNSETKAQESSRGLTAATLAGLLLMIAGFALLVYQGIRYTLEMQSDGAGSSRASRPINLPLSPLVGISAMFGGYVLIVRDRD